MAHRIGAPATVAIGGIACIVGSFAFARKLPSLRKLTRPIYIEKGIIPKTLNPADTTDGLH